MIESASLIEKIQTGTERGTMRGGTDNMADETVTRLGVPDTGTIRGKGTGPTGAGIGEMMAGISVVEMKEGGAGTMTGKEEDHLHLPDAVALIDSQNGKSTPVQCLE